MLSKNKLIDPTGFFSIPLNLNYKSLAIIDISHGVKKIIIKRYPKKVSGVDSEFWPCSIRLSIEETYK